ncbi:hypothetical protein DVH24_040115 [Malus domestica]|uniref:Uncharacterized protein n=1 Tax=Malus domestica TaxID=3750 RepID=A0A498I7I6_MALDO|nr:hypothetical protein DVH24_040115 [Malus domestica]
MLIRLHQDIKNTNHTKDVNTKTFNTKTCVAKISTAKTCFTETSACKTMSTQYEDKPKPSTAESYEHKE